MFRSSSSLRGTRSSRAACFFALSVLAFACGDDDFTLEEDASGPDGSVADASVDARPHDASDGDARAVDANAMDSSDARADADTADTTAPTVLLIDPAANAENVSTDTEVHATFNEAMNPTSLQGSFHLVRNIDNAPVEGVSSFLLDTLTFVPNDSLELDTVYRASIAPTVTDLAGNPLATPYEWIFRTDDTAPIGPGQVHLGGAHRFTALAESAITNDPTSDIRGDIGISPQPATFITGFPMVRAGTFWTTPEVEGAIFAADNDDPTPAMLTVAVDNMHTAYTDAAGRAPTVPDNFQAGLIGGATLAPGCYKWTVSLDIAENLTLSGRQNDTWIFQVTGDVQMAAAKQVILTGGARSRNVYWQVTGLVNVGVGSHFEGTVLSKSAIHLMANSSLNGRLLAQTAADFSKATLTRADLAD